MGYRLKNRLKIWILKPELYTPRVLGGFVASAVVDLQGQYNSLTTSAIYQLDLQSSEAAAQEHYEKVKLLASEIQDLDIFLMENNEDGRFSPRIDELSQLPIDLTKFEKSLKQISEFTKEFERKKFGALSLHEPGGLELLENKWDGIKEKLQTQDLDMSGHPAVSTLKEKFEAVRNKRKQVSELLTRITNFSDEEKEIHWVSSTDQFSIQAKKDLLANVKAVKKDSIYQQTLNAIAQLQELDDDNVTNWKDIITFGEITGNLQIGKYLESENEKVEEISILLEKWGKKGPPIFQLPQTRDQKSTARVEEFLLFLDRAEYKNALIIILNWLGFPENPLNFPDNELPVVIKKTIDDLEGIEEWIDLENYCVDGKEEVDKFLSSSVLSWIWTRKINLYDVLSLMGEEKNVEFGKLAQQLIISAEILKSEELETIRSAAEYIKKVKEKYDMYQKDRSDLELRENDWMEYINRPKISRSITGLINSSQKEKVKQKLVESILKLAETAPACSLVNEKKIRYGLN